MKHSRLHGVAHNFADSLAGGLSFVIPNHPFCIAVFAEAAATNGGFVVLDILRGTVAGGCEDGDKENPSSLDELAFPPFSSLKHSAPLLMDAFPAFCAKHV